MDRPLPCINIVPGQGSPQLSKAQKSFNRLIQQIGKRRTQLAAWEEITPPFQRRYTAELLPLLEAAWDLKAQMARTLDRTSGQKGLTRSERGLISGLIVELVAGVVGDADEGEMKALYNKHAGSDYDEDEAAMLEGLKAMMEDGLGIDLGDDVDMRSPDEVVGRLRECMEQRQREEAAAFQEREARRAGSARAQAREERRKDEERRVGQSIREVYRKLASALHPDREPDPEERDRKTRLMQHANQAYEKGNLLQLLELQLELEHIDQAAMDGIGEERLSHYTKVLKEQLAELDEEILRVEGEFRMRFGVGPQARVSPATLMGELATQIAWAELDIRTMREDLCTFGDPRATKAWLKAMPQRPWMEADDPPF
jgi:hypothetical protein